METETKNRPVRRRWLLVLPLAVVVIGLIAALGMWLLRREKGGPPVARQPAPPVKPEPDSPNADLMAEFLNHRGGQTFQSIPVIVFYTEDLRLLYRYTEFPAVYHKDRIRGSFSSARPGETSEQTKQRANKEFMEMLGSPFFDVWRAAALDEWTAMLYERLRVGSLA